MSRLVVPTPLASKIGLLGALYFSQGLPFGFFTQTIPVVLRDRGWSLDHIGYASLLALPWALKFLWAPLVDRWSFPALGKRRSWILPLQALTVLFLAGLALPRFEQELGVLLAAVFLLNVLAATQDIATDGLAVELLHRHERGLGNGLQVAGYRVGMILGGGAILISLEYLGWTLSLGLMAFLVLVASWPVLRHHEAPPPRRPTAAPTPQPASHFLATPGALRLLLLVVLFKFGDALGVGMLRHLLDELGLRL